MYRCELSSNRYVYIDIYISYEVALDQEESV